ncbi:MAG TPA: hypothetical protein VGR06_21730 [Actinophytocola sp.]|uniref:hypothetical protein n=1 Tax=Actinophytocola sp. TaxID=1872138 RepID=UPI002E0310E2|nr:hypothetical protein [Actinophytocola sp.]
MRRRVRVSAGAVALTFALSATLWLSGSAAAAPAPIVIGSCATSVQGAPGQPVSLSPSAVLSPVVSAVKAVDPLGLIWPGVKSALSALPPIPIGVLPTGTGFISGAAIATSVIAKLPLLGLLFADAIRSSLTSLCGVTVTGVNAVAAPVQSGAEQLADAANQAESQLVPGAGGGGTQPGTSKPGGGSGGSSPGGGSSSGGSSPLLPNQPVLGGMSADDLSQFLWPGGRSPMTDYSGIPYARAGLFAPSPGVRYGGAVSGYTPQFGILGSAGQDGVQVAGNAEALRPPSGTKIALPVLLAVFALAGVTAALVRTWVLRRAPAA